MQGPGRLSKKGVLWPPPPGRREPALWPISALVQELWRATGNLQTRLWSPRFFKWLSMSWSRMLKVFYRVQSSSAAKAGVLRACRSVCNCPWVPLGTNWNQKGEKSKPGTLPDAHAGAGKTITAIIFKCFLSARPVPSAFHGLPHSLLQQPHGAGTVTDFTDGQTKPQPSILTPLGLQHILVIVPTRRQASPSIARVSPGPLFSTDKDGIRCDVITVTEGTTLLKCFCERWWKSWTSALDQHYSIKNTTQATIRSHSHNFKCYSSHIKQ